MVWHNYDLGCAGTAFNPASTTDTWLGNQAFNVAKFAVGGVNWAHYLISDGGNLLAPLDGVIRDATSGDVRGRLHHVDRPRAGRAVGRSCSCSPSAGTWPGRRSARRSPLAALMVGSAAYLTPVEWAKAADGLLLDGVTQMQEGFLSPGRARRPRHAADRARRPGRLRQLAARRVRLARRAAGPAAGPEPAARADVHQAGGGRGPRQRGAGGAEEGRLRRGGRPDGRPLHLLPGQVRQPDRRRRPRRDPGRVHRAVPAAEQGPGAHGAAAAAADGDDGARDRGGRRAQARDPAGAAAGGGRGDRQHDRRRRAGRACTRCWSSRCSGPARASTCGSRCWSPGWSRWCCGRWRGRSGGWCRWCR